MERHIGDALTVSPQTLCKRLAEKRLLVTTGKQTEGRETLLVRRLLERQRRNVLHIHAGALSGTAKPDQPDHSGAGGDRMDIVTLLREAEDAGLQVRAEGVKLIVRGPRSLESLARKLLERKPMCFRYWLRWRQRMDPTLLLMLLSLAQACSLWLNRPDR